MAMYGAPIWHRALTANKNNLATLRRAQRAITVRAVRGYRTIAHEAACALAGTPPWEVMAGAYASAYKWRVELRARGVRPTPAMVVRRKLYDRRLVLQKWQDRLARAKSGLRVAGAVHPVLTEWVDRQHGLLSFRLVQVLSGHGCFGSYLHRIAGREIDERCHHCGGCDRDTAQHTLEECPAWCEQRRVLVNILGGDLSLPTVIEKMVGSEECWNAVASFCEEVISRKEAAERERENDPDALPLRRKRGEVRRRQFLRRLL